MSMRDELGVKVFDSVMQPMIVQPITAFVVTNAAAEPLVVKLFPPVACAAPMTTVWGMKIGG